MIKWLKLGYVLDDVSNLRVFQALALSSPKEITEISQHLS
jgi:hypothetical protein